MYVQIYIIYEHIVRMPGDDDGLHVGDVIESKEKHTGETCCKFLFHETLKTIIITSYELSKGDAETLYSRLKPKDPLEKALCSFL